eukprot:scaffold19026_cov157-Isochrysis_galbana.AAC.2
MRYCAVCVWCVVCGWRDVARRDDGTPSLATARLPPRCRLPDGRGEASAHAKTDQKEEASAVAAGKRRGEVAYGAGGKPPAPI